jgi:hypothetical protein
MLLKNSTEFRFKRQTKSLLLSGSTLAQNEMCRKVATLEMNTGRAADDDTGKGIYLSEMKFGRGKVIVH